MFAMDLRKLTVNELLIVGVDAIEKGAGRDADRGAWRKQVESARSMEAAKVEPGVVIIVRIRSIKAGRGKKP